MLRRGVSALPGSAAEPSGKIICIISFSSTDAVGEGRLATVVGLVVSVVGVAGVVGVEVLAVLLPESLVGVVELLPPLSTPPVTKLLPIGVTGCVVVAGVLLTATSSTATSFLGSGCKRG